MKVSDKFGLCIVMIMLLLIAIGFLGLKSEAVKFPSDYEVKNVE